MLNDGPVRGGCRLDLQSLIPFEYDGVLDDRLGVPRPGTKPPALSIPAPVHWTQRGGRARCTVTVHAAGIVEPRLRDRESPSILLSATRSLFSGEDRIAGLCPEQDRVPSYHHTRGWQ